MKESRPIPWLRRRAAGRAARARGPPPRPRGDATKLPPPSPPLHRCWLGSDESAHPSAETATKAAAAFTDAARDGRRPHPGGSRGPGRRAGPRRAWARASPRRGNLRRALENSRRTPWRARARCCLLVIAAPDPRWDPGAGRGQEEGERPKLRCACAEGTGAGAPPSGSRFSLLRARKYQAPASSSGVAVEVELELAH
jgi:hypothetical protein